MRGVTFHLPVVYNDGEPIPTRLLRRLFANVLEFSDGYTQHEIQGAWKHAGKTYEEPMLRVMVWLDASKVEGFVELIVNYLKTRLKQEAVWIEIDGKPQIL